MSRTRRTKHEDYALQKLTFYLQRNFTSVSIDPDVTDHPDALIQLDGKQIACEMSLVGVEDMFVWYHTKRPRKKDVQYIIRLPNEPHMWVAKILKKKRLSDYKGEASEMWLVIHTEAQPSLPIFFLDAWTKKAMAVPLAHFQDQGSLKHNFDSLWLVYQDEALCLWKRGTPVEDPEMDVSKGFPTYTHILVNSEITRQGANIDLKAIPVEQVITLQPCDKAFKLLEEYKVK